MIKTPEEILKPYIEIPLRHTKIVDVDDAIKAMYEYAAQFIHPQTCYSCNGSGRLPELSDQRCITCQGVGKIVILPPITTTLTQPYDCKLPIEGKPFENK